MPRNPNTTLPKSVRRFFEQIGAKGGDAAAARMTVRQRKRRAKKAAEARWAKREPLNAENQDVVEQ